VGGTLFSYHNRDDAYISSIEKRVKDDVSQRNGERRISYGSMLRCLNPKKAHENRGAFARSASSGATVALSDPPSSQEETVEEGQVACQFCKYLLEGAILGDCRVIRWIGSGTFGDVYEAEQLPPLNRRVAIKVMAMEQVIDSEATETFAREVGTIAALDHPHILPVLRVGTIEDGRSYFVMKYAARGSLQQFCQPAVSALSMLPTASPANLAGTPSASLAIVSAETLSIVDAIEEQADCLPVNAPGSDEDESERTDRLEHRKRAREPGKAQSESTEAAPDGRASEQVVEEAEDEGKTVDLPEESESIGQEQASETSAEAEAIEEEEETEAHSETEDAAREQAEAEEGKAGSSTSGAESPLNPASKEPEQQESVSSEQQTARASTLILANNMPHALAAPPTYVRPAGVTILSPQQVLRYLEEAAQALHYAHERGLIHLDVKPANLLLDAEGRLMLADFGVSVLLDGYTHASLHYYVGTPLYTAPEQWLEQPRAASDQYALAVTCYQLLTGRPPFTGNLYAVMHGHLQAPPPLMSEFNPLIPAPVEAVIQRALAKDPAARYPDMLAFARAYREALENAANADTDTRMQKRVSRLLEQHTTEQLLQKEVPLAPPGINGKDTPTEEQAEERSAQPGMFKAEKAEWEAPDDRLRPQPGRWARSLLLGALALLLIASGSLGFVRAQRPCWLNICPRITLSASSFTFTNDASQPIKITNTGTDTLNWRAQWQSHYPWLSLSAESGTLAPNQSSTLVLTVNADKLARSGIYTDTLYISGGPGVATKDISLTENVVKNLDLVSIKTSGLSFLYEQGHLQPGKQKITITNHSGRTLTWFTQYTDNNWLTVTPSQGNLADNTSTDLTATVSNPQALPNDTYQVTFSLVGKLDNQTDFTLLQTINFTLRVNSTSALAPTVVSTSTPQQSPLSFTAQPVTAPGAPAQLRSNHSMVWDSQDDLLLVFGGIDSQGNLLNDLWSYSPASNKWTSLTPANSTSTASNCVTSSSPAPRMNAAMVWDNVDQQALLYGGEGTNGSYLSDLWAYSPSKGTWTALACSGNGPGGRGGAGVAWTGSQMLILGGLGPGGLLGDFWAYTPGTGWSQISAAPPTGARAYPAVSWDSKEKQLYVFGGLKASGQQLGDFYVYRPGSGWHIISSGNAAAPLPRQQALSAWDSADNVFLLMGGWQASGDTTHSALWAYSPARNAWWEITSLQNSSVTSVIPSRLASVMVWDSADNRAYIYAGAGGLNKTAFNDLWMLSPA
jgi:serine/threonine protein kinase